MMTVIAKTSKINNMEHLLSFIKMSGLQNFYNNIQISNCNLMFLSYWLRGKLALPLQDYKLKLLNNFVKQNMDQNQLFLALLAIQVSLEKLTCFSSDGGEDETMQWNQICLSCM